MSAKESQHSALISALEAAGWTVKLIVILVGSAGTVFHPALDFLTSLGVSQHAATLCLRRLHLHMLSTHVTLSSVIVVILNANSP